MRRAFVSRQTLITKVNVTPIIDVALVLVIILLVTAPMLSVSDLPVKLPEAQTRESEDERNLSITLSPAGDLAVDNDIVAREALGPIIQARLAERENENILVVVRADADAPYSAVKELLEVARTAGARRLALATQQKAEVAK